MKKWQQSLIEVVVGIFAVCLGLSVTFGCYYVIMLMAKKVFFGG